MSISIRFAQSKGLTAGIPTRLALSGTCAGVAVNVLRDSNPLSCAAFAPSPLRDFIATMGAERMKQEFDIIRKVVETLREINSNDLEKPAIIAPEFKGLLQRGNFDSLIFGKKGEKGVYPDKLKTVFIADKTKGYSAAKLVKFYNPAQDDIQSIVVNWFYKLPAKSNADQFHPNLDPRSFYYAMQNRFDWNKLAGLVVK